MDMSLFLEQQANALLAYQKAMSIINNRRQMLVSQYGFQNKGNTDHPDYQLDLSNRYGLTQMMKQTQGQDLMGAYNQATDRGIGHSGLGNQPISALNFSQGGEAANLGIQFQGGLLNLDEEANNALRGYNDASYNARLSALNAAIANMQQQQGPYPPQTPAPPYGYDPSQENPYANRSNPNLPYGATTNPYAQQRSYGRQ